MAAYFATEPLFFESAFVDVVAGWIAATGGGILAATGATVALSGPIIRTADRRDVARERWCERIRDSTLTNTGATGNDGRAERPAQGHAGSRLMGRSESWPDGQIS